MKRPARLQIVEDVQVTSGTNDNCVVLLGNDPAVLSYDAAYELALQLAQWIQHAGEESPAFAAH